MAWVPRLRFINSDRTRLPVRQRKRPRGVPNALADYPVASTADRKMAVEVTSQLLGRCEVRPRPGQRERLQCNLYAFQALDVTLAYLDYGVATDVAVSSAHDCYTVHMTTFGEARVRIGAQAHDLSAYSALVVSPGTAYELNLAHDSPQLIVRIERDAMERQLSRMLGRSLPETLRFEPVSDLTTEAATRWHGALTIISTELMSPRSLLHAGVGATALEELLISTLLYLQPSNYSSRLRLAPTKSGRVAVTRSVDYIEQHLAEPISLTDLAEHTKMSPRSIQAGFREDLDTTPVAYIRDRRLDRVRQTLISAQPGDGTNVTEAAQRWGFSHLGNFSVTYRQRFGESPSETLRR